VKKPTLVILMIGALACGGETPPEPGPGPMAGAGGSGGRGTAGSGGSGAPTGTGGGGGSAGSATGGSGGGGPADAGGSPAEAGSPDSGSAAPTTPSTGRQFGSHPTRYPMDTIRPTGPQATLDAAVKAAYDRWKTAYLGTSCDGHFLKSPSMQGTGATITSSRVHGWGMLVAAIMAGHDPDARKIFDGFLTIKKKVGSVLESASRPGNANLMGNGVTPMCGGLSDGDAATAGDVSIAFALLLADRQWQGAPGAFNYLEEAKLVITALKAYEMNPQSKTPLVGDWCSLPGEPVLFQNATRPTEFAYDHFRAFAVASGDMFWKEAVESCYTIATGVQMRNSAAAGLLPETLANSVGQATPAGNFLGSQTSNAFSGRAALALFRFASDYVVSSPTDPRGKAALARANTFIKTATGGDPARLGSGYRLDGTALSAMASGEMEAAFAAAAIVDPANQAWLDALWARLQAAPPSGVVPDTLRLLSMILVSGNWWAP
jgi:hypothetical protein